MNVTELEVAGRTEKARQDGMGHRIRCCASTPCLSSGGSETLAALKDSLATRTDPNAEIVQTGCMGPCSRGPLVAVQAPGADEVVYAEVSPEDAEALIARHVDGVPETGIPLDERVLERDWPFFARQVKVVLANSGRIDPERIDDAIAHGTYLGLAHALTDLTPEDVCAQVTASGLRGRGGAGYSTGLKWNIVRKAPAERRYVVANGDEGDPGAYMDRTLMESDPHRILEGMAIAGYAVGADQGYVYVRGEYPIAARRLDRAIRQAERRGLLGSRILDSAFSFRIDVRIGAGAFVCGEETALLASIMGRRGEPRPRPPYPSESGLWGSPTLINNVETFGNIAPIIRDGPEAFAAIGTPRSRGTKIFALAGKVSTTGLVEVPMGITLREIVDGIGGGVPDGREFKAAQTGGPSGGCIPAEHLDVPVEYDTLKELGSIMGSGGLVVMDDHSCMPDVAAYFMAFCADESCGKCAPCRVGTVQLQRLLDRVTAGTARLADLATIEELSELLGAASLCGLGRSAPNPVMSTLRYFRDEYEAHVVEHRCPAGVCRPEPAGVCMSEEG